jgi:hypothetical protein
MELGQMSEDQLYNIICRMLPFMTLSIRMVFNLHDPKCVVAQHMDTSW